jgi:poly(A) polymerase
VNSRGDREFAGKGDRSQGEHAGVGAQGDPPRSVSSSSDPGLSHQPVGKLHPQPWMMAPQTRLVLDALGREGIEVRFIGGCVRDAVLKRPVRDIDLALPLSPKRVMALLRRANIKAIPTGIDHGTVTAVVDAMQFEITTLRMDVESYGRRAKVAFIDDWSADAARRDFTFNALSCTPDGDIYDYFGGLEDLGHGRVRFVGSARERIAEDVLRLLRFFRFYAYYGRPPPDEEALSACREWAQRVQTLSGERVRVELFRTLMATDPADVFQLMRDWRVLEHVLPEADGVARLKMLSWLDSRALRIDTVSPDPVRRLAALLAPDRADAEVIADRLRLSTRQKHRLAVMIRRPYPVEVDAGPDANRRALYHLGSESARDIALLAWAGELAERSRTRPGRSDCWTALLHDIDAWRPIEFPLKGRDALALGISPGPRMGALLREVEQWWERQGYRPGHPECIQQLQSLLAADE